MENTWKPKTTYFIKLHKIKLLEILDEIIVSAFDYNPDIEWKLEDVARGIKYLANDEVAINVQISNSSHTKEQWVAGWIDTEDFDLAKYYFQVSEFLSEEEYNALITLESNIII